MKTQELENPLLGYVVIAVALVVGMISATVFGQGSPASPADRTIKLPCDATIESTPSPNLLGQPQTESRRWVLGVRRIMTSSGCVVSEVIPGSAAARAALCPGDRIIAVNGVQVGHVGLERRSLFKAIDRSPSSSALLLVQRKATGLIQNIPVQLQTPWETMGH